MPLVVIDDFNFKRSTIVESETDAPLVVDAYAPLTVTVAMQRLQPVAGRGAQKIQRCGGVNLLQFAQGHARNVDELRHSTTVPQCSRILTLECLNHCLILTAFVIAVKRILLVPGFQFVAQRRMLFVAPLRRRVRLSLHFDYGAQVGLGAQGQGKRQVVLVPKLRPHRYTQVVEARHSGMDCRNPVTRM